MHLRLRMANSGPGASRGITRREILFVLLIASALTIYVSSLVKQRVDEALHEQAEIDLERITRALHQYKLDNLRYPSPDQGLYALLESPVLEPLSPRWAGPYLSRSSLIRDPWKRDYIYHSSDAPPSFSVKTFGADGVEGGSGENRDLLVVFESDSDY